MTGPQIAWNHLQWYRHLRQGWEPMKASHAWTQALVYEGKTLADVYVIRPDGSPWEVVTKLTLENYMSSAHTILARSFPVAQLLFGKASNTKHKLSPLPTPP